MNHKKHIYSCLIIVSLFGACNHESKEKKKIPFKRVTYAYNQVKMNLVQQKIYEPNLYLSIPENVQIQKTEGVDFEVVYLLPEGEASQDIISAGMYIGWWPSEFGPDSDSCKFFLTKSTVYKKNTNWRIYYCDSTYSMETIVSLGDEVGHIFARTRNEEGVKKILRIFSTVRKDY